MLLLTAPNDHGKVRIHAKNLLIKFLMWDFMTVQNLISNLHSRPCLEQSLASNYMRFGYFFHVMNYPTMVVVLQILLISRYML